MQIIKPLEQRRFFSLSQITHKTKQGILLSLKEIFSCPCTVASKITSERLEKHGQIK
jgi:hypothetical protein